MNLDFNFNQISHPTINSIEDIDQFDSDFVLLGVSDSEGGTAVTINKALLRGIIQAGSYNQLVNKPKINDVELDGNHDADYYGLATNTLANKLTDGLMSKDSFNKLNNIRFPAIDSNIGCIKIGRNLFMDDDETSPDYCKASSSDAYFEYESMSQYKSGNRLNLYCSDHNRIGIISASEFLTSTKSPRTIELKPLAGDGDIYGHRNKCIIINDTNYTYRLAPVVDDTNHYGKMIFSSNRSITTSDNTKYISFEPNDIALISFMYWNQDGYFSLDIQMSSLINSEIWYNPAPV